MGRSLHDKVRASSVRELHSDLAHSAVRAMDAALNFQADADLSYHRMVHGKSIRQLEKLDQQLTERNGHFYPAGAYREVQERLRKLIENKKKIEKELRLIGKKS